MPPLRAGRPADYAVTRRFVPALGAAALQLLDPQPGELILDVGCGDGALTAKIAAAGARVIGVDCLSGEMVEAARARGDRRLRRRRGAGYAGRAFGAVRRGLLQRCPALDARSRWRSRPAIFAGSKAGRSGLPARWAAKAISRSCAPALRRPSARRAIAMPGRGPELMVSPPSKSSRGSMSGRVHRYRGAS